MHSLKISSNMITSSTVRAMTPAYIVATLSPSTEALPLRIPCRVTHANHDKLDMCRASWILSERADDGDANQEGCRKAGNAISKAN